MSDSHRESQDLAADLGTGCKNDPIELRSGLERDDRNVANSIVRDVGAGRANAIVCGSVLSRALRVPPSISAEYRAES